MTQITVLIADDHALFREGLRLLLAQEADMRIVGEATDGLQTLAMAEALQPDILLLDIRMPGLGGLDVLPTLRQKCPATKVLILSGFFEEDLVIQALQRGAKGYLQKTATHADLVKAVRTTHAGELWAERRVLSEVLEGLCRQLQGAQVPLATQQDSLTAREHEIVEKVAQGMTNKEIAAQLGISEKTVKTHLSNIFAKLKISRRLQLLLYRIADRPGP
jgi:DNA-binding NarL/FixJ family response regulator